MAADRGSGLWAQAGITAADGTGVMDDDGYAPPFEQCTLKHIDDAIVDSPPPISRAIPSRRRSSGITKAIVL